YALASSGLALTYGLLRVLNFAQGHLMMLGAYVFFLFSARFGLPFPASVGMTAAVVLVVSTLMFRVFILPFAKIDSLLTLVATLALATMLEAVVALLFGVDVKTLATSTSFTSYHYGSVYITPIQLVIIGSAVVLLSAVACVIHATPLGRRIRALAEHPHAAEAIGVSRGRVSYGVFLLGAALSAYAGVLVGYESSMEPTMGVGYTVKAFAAMILGGLGNIWGAIIGSYLLGLIENLSIGLDFGGWSVPAGYKDAFAFSVILLMLLFRPQGLFGERTRRA
ncbi:MAG: branched-chain amino acid ABC transporter permease, partial [Bdellovibrionales bacterium]|nr:branched-chain amino acid ABC transporter permease [Bdellovibrionales bacterium]